MQVWQVLAISACAGLASLMLVPIERMVSSGRSPLVLRATTLLQPAFLTAVAVWVGCVLGPSVGLDAPLIEAILARGDVLSVFLVEAPIALLAGAFLAIVLVLYELRLVPKLPKSPLAAKLGEPPLATRLFYGGIVEELIFRWGLVSLLVWIAWRLGQRPAHIPEAYYWVAVSASAVLFAAGHLPLLFAAAGRPPVSLIGTTMAANGVGSLIFGWLFWRKGIEAAMIAHAVAHALEVLALRGLGRTSRFAA